MRVWIFLALTGILGDSFLVVAIMKRDENPQTDFLLPWLGLYPFVILTLAVFSVLIPHNLEGNLQFIALLPGCLVFLYAYQWMWVLRFYKQLCRRRSVALERLLITTVGPVTKDIQEHLRSTVRRY